MYSKISMKTIGLCFLLIFFISNAQSQEKAVILKTPTGDIYGTLLTPEYPHPVPVVLIHAGSGPTNRNGNNPQMKNNSLKMLAEGLQRCGIASLRFDKRGVAASRQAGLNEKDIRFEDYVNDTKAWVDTLSKDERFSSIIIAGHSEGALIGMLAAADHPAVKKFISIAGAGVPGAKILKKQLGSQPEALKKPLFKIIDKLEKGDTINNISPLLYSLFRPSVQPYLISWLKYNPATEIAKLNIPILLIQGTTDIQISENDAEALATAAPDAQKVIIENMNHVLKRCQETDMEAQMVFYSNPDIPLHPELLPDIVEFIKNPAKPKEP